MHAGRRRTRGSKDSKPRPETGQDRACYSELLRHIPRRAGAGGLEAIFRVRRTVARGRRLDASQTGGRFHLGRVDGQTPVTDEQPRVIPRRRYRTRWSVIAFVVIRVVISLAIMVWQLRGDPPSETDGAPSVTSTAAPSGEQDADRLVGLTLRELVRVARETTGSAAPQPPSRVSYLAVPTTCTDW
jgi:hypothetical protein